MPKNENPNEFNGAVPESMSFVSDDEALREIDFNSFLEETQKEAPLFEGFHEDIERTEKSLEDELQSLYDDIMNSGPATIVPKPISVITSEQPEVTAQEVPAPVQEPEKSDEPSLGDLWMNPEEYFEFDIPVVSLDDEEETAVPQEAYFNPQEQLEEQAEEVVEFAAEEPAAAPEFSAIDAAKEDIFGMINSLKAEADVETGFDSILSEIESNAEIVPVADEYGSIANMLSSLPETAPVAEPAPMPVAEPVQMQEESEEELIFDEDLAELEKEIAQESAIKPVEEKAEESEETIEGSEGFVINIPEDDNDYDFAASLDYSDDVPAAPADATVSPMDVPLPFDKIIDEPVERTVGNFEAAELAARLADVKETKEEKKARKKREKEEEKNQPKKPIGPGEVLRRVVLALSCLVIVGCIAYLGVNYIYNPLKAKNAEGQFAEDMSSNADKYGDAVVDAEIENTYGVDFPEGMLAKYAPLYAENEDLRGWIRIDGLGIEYPVVQGDDNDYYLQRDVYGEWTTYGVPFFDYRMDNFQTLHKNTVIYGHNMRYDDLIFGMLEDYRTPEGYKKAPVIECNTIYGDYTWLVYGVFITNSDPDDDNGYCLPYNFIDVDNQKFADYIAEIDKRKLYSTGVDINENDKILTLSTCCYDFDGARLVVVARLLRDGESINTSSYIVTENQNPKYPQVWYVKNKKENTYADDARW